VKFICSPPAEKLNDIIVTLVEPSRVKEATLFVPVIDRLPKIVELLERCDVKVSVIGKAELLPVVFTSAAPSMDALNVMPPFEPALRLTKTSNIFGVPAVILKPIFEKLYLSVFTPTDTLGSEMFHWIKSHVPVPLNVVASGSDVLYNATLSISAAVNVPLNVMFKPVIFIFSPEALSRNVIIETFLDATSVVAATLFVPVIENATSVELLER
jgi:hypothetical protein